MRFFRVIKAIYKSLVFAVKDERRKIAAEQADLLSRDLKRRFDYDN